MQQLSSMDAAFLYLEARNSPMHVGGLQIYDQSNAPGGVVRFKDFLQFFEQRLHLARCFRQKLVRVPFNLDHPYWVEDAHFDLEFHIRHIALPKPGDWRQLCIQLARLHARALDMSRPLWEVYVIEGLDNIEGLPPNCFAVYTKVHHAAIDGVSGAEMSAAVHDLAPDASPPVPAREWEPERDPTAVELITRANLNSVRYPFNFARVMAQSAPQLARAAAGITTKKIRPLRTPGNVPRTRFNESLSPHRVFEGIEFDLDTIKAIKNGADGATVNDVVLAICGGALRRYLNSKHDLPEESLIAMAPVSVRSSSEKGEAGNQISFVTTPLYTEESEPLARLKAIHEGMRQSKELNKAVGARWMTDYTQFIPSATFAMAARMYTQLGLGSTLSPLANCVVTNVPGPQIPLYSVGARLVRTHGLAPVFDGMGLNIAVFSYCGTLTISFVSCREMMPDPAYFVECLQASHDELREATAATAANPANPTKRKAKSKAKGTRSKAKPKARPKKKPATRRRPAETDV